MQERTKVLIVDDEPVNLDFFDVMLSKLGFEVETAEDGEQALEKLDNFFPDLIILDNVMPKMSGWQVTRLLKTDSQYEQFRNVPIIMFSAMDDVKDKVEGFELGIEDYITKPFNFSEVLARIRAVLRGRKLYDQLSVKEKKLELVDSLYDSFSQFLESLKEPVNEIDRLAQVTSVEDTEKVKEFIGYVSEETKKVRKSIEGLEKEIARIDSDEFKAGHGDEVLKELDEKMREHFSGLEEDEDSFKEVKK